MNSINTSNIISSTFKLNSALIGGGLVTVSLFYLMQVLVRNDMTPHTIVDYIPIEPITITDEKIEVIKKTLKPDEPVDPPVIEDDSEVILTDDFEFKDTGVTVAKLDNIIDVIGPGVSLDNGSALAIRQVRPIYPNNALNKGIEGFVIIEFDINPAGIVVDPRVVYAEPENIFNRSALRAISRWTFSPKVEKGKEVYQYNEKRRISFTIDG